MFAQIFKKRMIGWLAGSLLLSLTATSGRAGVVAYYTFDNPDDLGLDSSGNGYNLTAGGASNGGPTAVTGVSGNAGDYAASFNGVDDIFTAPANELNPSTTSFSMSFWVQTSDSTNANNGKDISRTSGSSGFNVNTSASSGTPTYHVSPSSGTAINSGVAESSTWQLIAISFDGTAATTTMYVNAVSKGTSTSDTYIAGTAAQYFGLGAKATGTGVGSNFFLGNIDDFAVYNQTLSQAQVTELDSGETPLQVTPEPSSVAVFGLGFILMRRRRRQCI